MQSNQGVETNVMGGQQPVSPSPKKRNVIIGTIIVVIIIVACSIGAFLFSPKGDSNPPPPSPKWVTYQIYISLTMTCVNTLQDCKAMNVEYRLNGSIIWRWGFGSGVLKPQSPMKFSNPATWSGYDSGWDKIERCGPFRVYVKAYAMHNQTLYDKSDGSMMCDGDSQSYSFDVKTY